LPVTDCYSHYYLSIRVINEAVWYNNSNASRRNGYKSISQNWLVHPGEPGNNDDIVRDPLTLTQSCALLKTALFSGAYEILL